MTVRRVWAAGPGSGRLWGDRPVRAPRREEPAIAAAAHGPQSLDRALDLLDAVADAPGPVTARDLADRLGCSLSTVYTLLGPLTARGHLARTRGGYVLGPRIPALHRAYRRREPAEPDVRDLLLRVARAAGTPAYYSTYRDGRIAVVESTGPAAADGDPFEAGTEPHAHATAHGKVLLAALSRPARRRYLAEHGLPRFTEHTITDPDRLEAELGLVRRLGLAVSVGEYDPDWMCLAVPLPPSGGGPARALSVSLPTAHRAARGRIGDVLTRAARQFG